MCKKIKADPIGKLKDLPQKDKKEKWENGEKFKMIFAREMREVRNERRYN